MDQFEKMAGREERPPYGETALHFGRLSPDLIESDKRRRAAINRNAPQITTDVLEAWLPKPGKRGRTRGASHSAAARHVQPSAVLAAPFQR